MGNLNTRLSKLEQQRPATARQFLILREDIDNPAVYRDGQGKEYSRAELVQLGETHTVLLITYADAPGPGTIADIGDMALWDAL